MAVSTIEKRDLSRMKRPSRVQDVIPIKRLYESGMRYLDDNRYAKTFEITDIDYSSSGDDERADIFDRYSTIINSFDGSKSVYKLTICNQHVNKHSALQQSLLSADVGDGYDNLRLAYNRLRYDDIQGDNAYIQRKFLTISTYQSKEEKADAYFVRSERDMNKRFLMLDSSIRALNAEDYLEMIYDFFNAGKEEKYNYKYDNKKYDKRFGDYICPDAMRIHDNYIEIGGKIARCMMVKNFGGVINDDFLVRLAELKTNMMLTLDIIPVSNGDARKVIDRKDDDVEANADTWSNKRSIREGSAIRLPRQVKKDRKVIDEYIEDMDERNQKMFMNQIVVAFLADNMTELEDLTESLMETAAESSAQMSILYFQQLQGLQNAIPFGVRRINNLRDCNTDTTAMLIPFDQVRMNHNSGIPYGRHEGTKQQQMVDRRLLVNGHEWVFGMSGSGKSMNVKQKTLFEALLTDGDIVIVDPDGEGRPLVEALGGQVIHVGRDSINVADILLDYGDPEDPIDPVKNSSDFVISFIETILNSGADFGEMEKSLVDRALRALYQGVINGAATYITLEDVYDTLMGYGIQAATNLAISLERHVIGSFNCFAKETTVNIHSRIVCYDLSTLPKQLKNAGMMVVMNHIDQRLIANRKLKRATYIKFEEMDYYFSHQASTVRIKDFFERARKYGGFITAVIQNITRVLQVPEAHMMIQNAANVIMMKQEKDDAEELARMYGLSNIQVKALRYAEIGHGINKIGDVIYSFDCTIPKDNEIYKLIHTDVVDVA